MTFVRADADSSVALAEAAAKVRVACQKEKEQLALIVLDGAVDALVSAALAVLSNASALPQSVTAETFQCDESHSSALGCNFECLPYTCVTQQMMEHAAKEQVEQGRRPQV